MTDGELQKLLGALGDEPVPTAPRVDDTAIVDAMVKATKPAVRRTRWVPWALAASVALVASGLLGASAWRQAPPRSVAHVHGQSGDVMVVAMKGAGAAVEAGGRAIAAGDRVVTLGEGRAVVAMSGATAAVGPRAELVVGTTTEPVVVRGGSARFDVSKREPTSPFRVRANDVDITVYGTSFSVAVDGPRVRVTVFEGVVGVHPADGPEIKLTAGQTWPASEVTAPAVPNATSTGDTTAPRVVGAADDRAAPSVRHDATAPVAQPAPQTSPTATSKPTPATQSASTALGDQNELLAKAAEARRKGDSDGERRALDAFVKKFADAPGLHDALAAKMRAAARSGDKDAAATEARSYLARFPDGPLRDEALSQIARATKR